MNDKTNIDLGKTTENKVDDAIFDFVYELALRDATMRKAFSGNREWLRKSEEGNKAKQIVKNYINSVIEDGVPNFKNTVEDVWKALKNENGNHVFTFGNCQKLVNMTVKYMFITAYKNDEQREKFKDCHCPMDGIMIKRVVELALDNPNLLNYNDVKKIKDCSWSRLEFQDGQMPQEYVIFQNAIKVLARDISPIEFDYIQWQKD